MKALIACFLLMFTQIVAHGAEQPVAGKTLSGDSIYQLDSSWVDQAGRKTKLSTHRGKPALITMVYTSCQYSCPMVIEELKKILKQLPESDQDKAAVLLVSFDTEGDTPEKMRKFSEKKGLDPKLWTFFKGTPDAVREVAAALGINYKKADDTYFHTNVIAVLDSEGIIRYRQSSLGSDGKSASLELKKQLHPDTLHQ